MNADEVQKQLENMRAFIVREAHEKVCDVSFIVALLWFYFPILYFVVCPIFYFFILREDFGINFGILQKKKKKMQ